MCFQYFIPIRGTLCTKKTSAALTLKSESRTIQCSTAVPRPLVQAGIEAGQWWRTDHFHSAAVLAARWWHRDRCNARAISMKWIKVKYVYRPAKKNLSVSLSPTLTHTHFPSHVRDRPLSLSHTPTRVSDDPVNPNTVEVCGYWRCTRALGRPHNRRLGLFLVKLDQLKQLGLVITSFLFI